MSLVVNDRSLAPVPLQHARIPVDCPEYLTWQNYELQPPQLDTIHLRMAPGAHGVAEIASTIQTASINRHPDPHQDTNQSTATSRSEAVVVGSSSAVSDIEEDEIPISILQPPPRTRSLPPLPDLRFEQSYLRSIEHANGWGAVAYITIRDQVRVMTCSFPICPLPNKPH
jgi:hypothetical protein